MSQPIKINIFKHNARSKQVLNVKCCVCLNEAHPSKFHYCRKCDSGMVCVDCITKIDKRQVNHLITHLTFGVHTIDLKPQAQPPLRNGLVEINPVLFIRPSNNAPIITYSDDNERFFETLQELIYLTIERGNVWGYGNDKTTKCPTCPCCRAKFSFFAKGWQMTQGLDNRLGVNQKKLWSNLWDTNTETLTNDFNSFEDLETNQTLMKWFEMAVSFDAGKAFIPERVSNLNLSYNDDPEHSSSCAYRKIGLYWSLSRAINDNFSKDDIWCDVMALETCAKMTPDDPISKEFLDLFRRHKEHHYETILKVKSFVKRAHEFKHMDTLKATYLDTPGALNLTPSLMNPIIVRFAKLYSGAYAEGVEGEVVTKSIPSKVDNLLTSYNQMTKEEKMLLINEINMA